jgi:adenosine deaminase
MDLKIKDLIYRQNSLVPKDKCKYFIDIFERSINKSATENSLKYIEGKNLFRHEDNHKILNLSSNYENKEIKEAADLAAFYISIMVLNYINYLKIKISKAVTDYWISKTSHIRILKYSTGEQILDHLDLGLLNRASCTLNLNEEYTGGEFSFFSGKHLETFKTGDAMIFPAEPIWIHGTKPIKSGTRYALNCFLKPFKETL